MEHERVDLVPITPFEVDRDAALSGTIAVEASAGTGKTWSIEQILVRRVIAGGRIDRVVLMTFTRAAAEELAERSRAAIHRRLRSDTSLDAVARGRLERALLDFDQACITTIHAFCNRMLIEHSSEAGEWSIAGWTQDPDSGKSARLAIGDAWAIVAAKSPHVTVLARVPSAVRKKFKDALDGRSPLPTSKDRAKRIDEWRREAVALVGEAALPSAIRALADLALKPAAEKLGVVADAIEVAHGAPAKESDAAIAGLAEVLSGPPGDLLVNVEKAVEGAGKKAANQATMRTALMTPQWVAWRQAITAVRAGWASVHEEAIAEIAQVALDRHAERVAKLKYLDFHAMLVRTERATLTRPMFREAVAARFDLVVVDEAQDTDPLQATIIERLFTGKDRPAGTALYLVGDPKQSIYLFRGADLGSYLRLGALAGDQVRSLGTSYRSDPEVVKGVAAFFTGDEPFGRKGIVLDGVTSAYPSARMRSAAGAAASGVRIFETMGDASWPTIAAGVASAIATDLAAECRVSEDAPGSPVTMRALVPGDIAVLCRSHDNVKRMFAELRALRVPAVALGRSSVFASEMAGELAALLGAISSPRERARVLGACSGILMGMDAELARSEGDTWVGKIRDAAEHAERYGIVSALRCLAAPRLGALLTEPDGEQHESDLQHLLELLDGAEASGVRGAVAMATWLATQMDDAAATDDDDSRTRLPLGADTVKVQTLHASKGLTYGVTWLPTFMLKRSRSGNAPVPTAGELEELKRQLYVGLTRSRWQTNVVWNAVPDAADSPVRKLLALGQTLADVAKASGGAITLVPLPTSPPSKYSGGSAPLLHAALATPAIPRPMDLVSFSRLSAQAEHAEPDVEGADRDASSMVDRAPTGSEWASECDRAIRAVGARGRVLGTALHESLEDAQAFAALASGGDRAVLARMLESRLAVGTSKGGAVECAALAGALADVLALPIGATRWPTVAECAAKPRGTFRELRLATNWRGDAHAIADAFALEPAPWAKRFAAEVRRLGAAVFEGLFIGTLDLVRCEESEWYIYDYKSNDLGRAAEEYLDLDPAMISSRYPLQAALYAVALRQWIAARQGIDARGTDPIAGVAYLFVRGMDCARPGQGVWTWRPSVALLDALTDIIGVDPQVQPS